MPKRAPDPILAELWEIKRQINAEGGYDIEVLTRMAREAAERILLPGGLRHLPADNVDQLCWTA
jgi:hypothetical protein